MKLSECKVGDAVRLPDGRNAIVSVASIPGTMFVALARDRRDVAADTDVTLLVPATEVEEAASIFRSMLDGKLVNSSRVVAFLNRHERKEGA